MSSDNKSAEKSIQQFKSGYNCAQSVLYGFAAETGLDVSTALKLACGFGGGYGRRQLVCGAVSGAVCVLGLLYGRSEHDDKQAQEKTYTLVRTFIELFEKKFGSAECRTLVNGIDLLTPEGQEQFKQSQMHDTCCTYVEGAHIILRDIVNRHD